LKKDGNAFVGLILCYPFIFPVLQWRSARFRFRFVPERLLFDDLEDFDHTR